MRSSRTHEVCQWPCEAFQAFSGSHPKQQACDFFFKSQPPFPVRVGAETEQAGMPRDTIRERGYRQEEAARAKAPTFPRGWVLHCVAA